MTQLHHTTCPLCEAMCGLTIETEGGTVASIRGDAEDPFSQGHICPKAHALKALHEDPDRLRRPMRRDGDTWTEISWEEAFDLAVTRLTEIRASGGANSVGMYVGNPTVHNAGAILGAQFFLRCLSSRARFSASTVDQRPHELANHLLYGQSLLFGVPDVDRTELFVIVGANPLVSNGSIMTTGGIRPRLEKLQARGGRVVVVDPRRTQTAELADTHHFIRPETDAFLLAALAHELLAAGVTPDRVEGLDGLRELVAPWTAEAAAARTGISADAIRTLAHDLRATRSVLYGRLGSTTSSHGGLAAWLLVVVNHLAGNLDVVGGLMFPEPAVDLVRMGRWLGAGGSRDRYRSRVRGLPEVSGELPAVCMAEEITTPGEDRIRAMVTFAGNPVLSIPGGDALGEAFDQLEFMVSIDIYLNETTRHADLILPPVSALERPHFDMAFQALAVRNTVKFSEALFDKPADGRTDYDILTTLSWRILKARGRRLQALKVRAARRLGWPRLVDAAMRLGQHKVTLKKLRAAPHGIDLGPLRPNLFSERLEGSLDLSPPLIREGFERLAAHPEPTEGGLLLIGRRDLRTNNSWMHNVRSLVKGKNRCTLLMHPSDASERSVADGDTVRLSSAVGAVEVPVALTDSIMRGVVSLPHGWGHGQQGTRMQQANAHPGVNHNVLTDPSRVDPLSGTAALSGVPVDVEPV